MGNNHDQYFSKEKRNILVLGIENSGKSTLVHALVADEINRKVPPTKDLSIRDAKLKNLSITFFDLAGGQRQRIFWKQHFEGTQCIIFLIDASSNQQSLESSIRQLQKVLNHADLQSTPVAIGISKCDLATADRKDDLNLQIQKKVSQYKQKIAIFRITYEDKGSMQKLAMWIIGESKPV